MHFQATFKATYGSALSAFLNSDARKRAGLLATFMLLAACAGSDPDPQSNNDVIAEEPDDGLLEPVASAEQFVSAMSSAMESVSPQSRSMLGLPVDMAFDALEVSQPAPALSADGAGASQNFSQTYTLEARVDENDIVKYNGEHLFVAKNRAFICCYLDVPTPLPILEPGPVDTSASNTSASNTTGVTLTATEFVVEPVSSDALVDARFAPEYEPPSAEIRVLVTDTGSASAEEVALIELDQRGHVNGMYLHNNQLVALSTQNSFLPYGAHFMDFRIWQQQQVNVDIYSVANARAPDRLHQLEVQGGLVDSRRIGDTLYL
ncbi:MAG: hypothetical protein HKO07_07355, partial [Pseudomonadales bacterium]|nr:hypothetical protein [Pseudomonadales bacterium]